MSNNETFVSNERSLSAAQTAIKDRSCYMMVIDELVRNKPPHVDVTCILMMNMFLVCFNVNIWFDVRLKKTLMGGYCNAQA